MLITPKTLIITGAGSNLEYGFLTGADLRKFLIFEYRDYFLSLFSSGASNEQKAAAEQYARQEIEEFARVFFNSRLKSIDYFLELNPNFAEVGKIGITCAIARAEARSVFAEEAPKASQNDWYSWLFNEHIAKNFRNQDLEKILSEIPIRFVTFNYDRSIEHFLFNAITHSLPHDKVLKSFLPKAPDLDFLHVRHMYGRLSPLPWQHEEAPRTVSEKYWQLMSEMSGMRRDPNLIYGGFPRNNMAVYAQNINLIGARIQQDKNDISSLFQWANRVFFLGFGFAEENLEALSILTNLRPDHDVFGTAFGLLDNEILHIKNTLASCRPFGDGKTIIEDVSILTLLRTYLT